jgi:hypothetical protein
MVRIMRATVRGSCHLRWEGDGGRGGSDEWRVSDTGTGAPVSSISVICMSRSFWDRSGCGSFIGLLYQCSFRNYAIPPWTVICPYVSFSFRSGRHAAAFPARLVPYHPDGPTQPPGRMGTRPIPTCRLAPALPRLRRQVVQRRGLRGGGHERHPQGSQIPKILRKASESGRKAPARGPTPLPAAPASTFVERSCKKSTCHPGPERE